MNLPAKSLAWPFLLLCFLFCAESGWARTSVAPSPAEWRIWKLANQDRATRGLGELRWDSSLALAARVHAERMAAQGAISHQFSGEAGLAERTGSAGAHFSLIEENVAVAPSPDEIHSAWMHSKGHYANLMNPSIDSIGVAVVATREGMFAVADYAQSVAVLRNDEIEAHVGKLLIATGLKVVTDRKTVEGMRRICGQESGAPPGAAPAHFVMRWQGPSLDSLPSQLTRHIRDYQWAVVGSCPAAPGGAEQASFTSYRVAVLLY